MVAKHRDQISKHLNPFLALKNESLENMKLILFFVWLPDTNLCYQRFLFHIYSERSDDSPPLRIVDTLTEENVKAIARHLKHGQSMRGYLCVNPEKIETFSIKQIDTLH